MTDRRTDKGHFRRTTWRSGANFLPAEVSK